MFQNTQYETSLKAKIKVKTLFPSLVECIFKSIRYLLITMVQMLTISDYSQKNYIFDNN